MFCVNKINKLTHTVVKNVSTCFLPQEKKNNNNMIYDEGETLFI